MKNGLIYLQILSKKILIDFQKSFIDECAEIFFDIYINEPFNYDWLDLLSVKKYFYDLYKMPKFKGFIFFFENNIIGACIGYISDYFKCSKFHISEIFIKRNFIQKGFGSEFISLIEKNLKGIGIEVIEFSTDKTFKAFDFYTKNGYKVLKDNVNMIKIL